MKGIGAKGSLATALPSNREFNKPKTIMSTMATTPPDLNLENERSRLDSFRLVSNLSFFFVFDFLVDGAEVFRVSNFLLVLSMVERRDL